MVSASGVQMGKTWAALHIRLLGVSVVLEGFGWFLSTRLMFPQAVRYLGKKFKSRRTHGNTSPVMWPTIMCLWLLDIARVIWQCICVRHTTRLVLRVSTHFLVRNLYSYNNWKINRAYGPSFYQ